jgi:hypothetical protein
VHTATAVVTAARQVKVIQEHNGADFVFTNFESVFDFFY